MPSDTFFGKESAVSSGDLTPSERVDCPLCGAEPIEFAVDYQGFHLCRCAECGLQFQNPRLSFNELAEKIYTKDYCPGHEETASDAAYERQIANFERFLGRKGSVLDVGCGNGSFLLFAERHGWRPFGADIALSPETSRLTCPLWEGRLPEIDFGHATFDVIRFNHVIEHLQNPLVELERCKSLLNPGGLIFIGVPNVAGLSPRIKNLQSRSGLKKKKWRHYAATHHLFFFTSDTLRAMIERSGYQVVEWLTPVDKEYGKFGGGLYRTAIEKLRAGSNLEFYIKLR